jgi:transcriptional regulator with XRE-family HTH domain
MAATKKPDAGRKSQGLAELGRLIENALARHGASARAIARRAGIGASHLSKFLKAQRSLKKAKLVVLADLLGLDREKVLRLAGLGTLEQLRLDLGRVTLLHTIDKFTLNVVVTPRFYDAAVFMWIFSQQPLTEVGVECQLRRAEWGNVPAELASYSYSVGLHNQTPGLFRLERWSHLCLYKGQALIGRGSSSAQGKEALATLTEQAKKRGQRLSLIATDGSMVDLLREATGVGENFEVQIIPNPDVALESFRAGAGDLFLGGLPQRLTLRKGEFREIITQGKEFPSLYSFQSLVCSERMLTEKRPLLHAIDALWYDTSRRLYTDAAFRGLVFDEICEHLERHGIEKHNFVKDDFEFLFSSAGLELEVFAQTPAHLWEEETKLRTHGAADSRVSLIAKSGRTK